MKKKSLRKMMSDFEDRGIRICGTASEFYGYQVENEGIWIAADSHPEFFEYDSRSWINSFGIEPSLNQMVENSGWYFEWYDPGTMMVWRD
jgi:hypothetical protein